MQMNTNILYFLLLFSLPASSFKLEKCLLKNNSTADIIRPWDDKYDDLNYQWTVRNPKYPDGFIIVKSTKDVQMAVSCLTNLEYKFRVKCGGHSFEKYSFGDQGEWVIDLKYLDEVSVNNETKIATIGAGIQFRNLLQKLKQIGDYGLPVGTCSSVGISGFTLGGGYGPFSQKFGLMTDRVVEIQVVTANAKVISANKEHHRGLFWALRGGGGGNFGIVTKFLLLTFNTQTAYIATITLIYEQSDFRTEFTYYQNWLKSGPSDSIGCLVDYSNPRKFSKFIFVIFERNSNATWKEVNNVRKYFPEIEDRDVTIEPFVDTVNSISFPYGNRNSSQFYYKAKSFYVSKFLSNEEIGKFIKVIKKHKSVNFLFETYGGAINRVASKETAFCHRNSLYVVQYFLSIRVKNSTDETNNLGESLIPQLNDFGKQLSFMSNGEAYVNYIDEQETEPFKKYYCENFDYLRMVKKRYDPKNVFQFPLSIPLYR